MTPQLTMGPILFNWPAEIWRDFYFAVADEMPVSRVCIGEVICSKRMPFFEPFFADVIDRLQRSGKEVVISTLAEVMIKRERDIIRDLCEAADLDIEANDASSLYHLRGRRFFAGTYLNVYNEDTLKYLKGIGAVSFALPVELPRSALGVLGDCAAEEKVDLEVTVFGRAPLALSARCYHARAHGRMKDNCQFVCEQDPDGMPLRTLQKENFLVVNGVQTLSFNCLNLAREMSELAAMGIRSFRLSPHSKDMKQIACIFHDVLHGFLDPDESLQRLSEIGLRVPFSNGFFYRQAGHLWIEKPPAFET